MLEFENPSCPQRSVPGLENPDQKAGGGSEGQTRDLHLLRLLFPQFKTGPGLRCRALDMGLADPKLVSFLPFTSFANFSKVSSSL